MDDRIRLVALGCASLFLLLIVYVSRKYVRIQGVGSTSEASSRLPDPKLFFALGGCVVAIAATNCLFDWRFRWGGRLLQMMRALFNHSNMELGSVVRRFLSRPVGPVTWRQMISLRMGILLMAAALANLVVSTGIPA
jgi:hypothetical protein